MCSDRLATLHMWERDCRIEELTQSSRKEIGSIIFGSALVHIFIYFIHYLVENTINLQNVQICFVVFNKT